jgi:hypothetical protein
VVRDDLVSVTTAAQVDDLIALLGRDDADDAYATHLGRPSKVDELERDHVPDHVMYLAVRDGWGYLRYIGTLAGRRQADVYTPIGDHCSPATHGTNNVDYPAVSGLALTDFRAVVVGFLTAGDLPTVVRWQDSGQPVAVAMLGCTRWRRNWPV